MRPVYLPSRLILPIIVIAQFCCTSLWFAGNGVMQDLVLSYNLDKQAIGNLLTAVQFGFIIGTFTFAFFTIVDRYPPSKVFLISAIFGSIFNLGIIWEGNTLASMLIFRFLTGFFLAGIYPVGMKIAADYFEKGLGKSLGYLVGALVLGTAFPHLLKNISHAFSWKAVLLGTSLLSLLGGFMMLFLVPNGPYRKEGQKLDITAVFKIFKNKIFRSAAIGYFGHMWELYTFWAFVPIMLSTYSHIHSTIFFNIPLMSFFIIGIGSFACVVGGYLAQAIGVKKMAITSLTLSGICCFFSPLVFAQNSQLVFIVYLLFWGMVVIADSPLFSTLIAQNAPVELKGTALTIVNGIGFSITIVSIQLVNGIWSLTESNNIYIILAIGPLIGVASFFRNFVQK